MLKSSIFQFDVEEPTEWTLISDGVMGGVSSGQVLSENSVMTFCGHLSLSNQGGFVIARRNLPPMAFAGWEGFWLKVRGDGRVYHFSCETHRSVGRFSWQCAFPTKARTWLDIFIGFSEFLPIRRGFSLDNVEDFAPSEIKSLGVQISDRQDGPFRLDISQIGVFNS